MALTKPPVPTTVAVCGLPCDACSIFIASHEDPERLAAIAARWGNTVEDTYCEGCRADSRTSLLPRLHLVRVCT